jgi:hypothetical protein
MKFHRVPTPAHGTSALSGNESAAAWWLKSDF